MISNHNLYYLRMQFSARLFRLRRTFKKDLKIYPLTLNQNIRNFNDIILLYYLPMILFILQRHFKRFKLISDMAIVHK